MSNAHVWNFGSKFKPSPDTKLCPTCVCVCVCEFSKFYLNSINIGNLSNIYQIWINFANFTIVCFVWNLWEGDCKVRRVHVGAGRVPQSLTENARGRGARLPADLPARPTADAFETSPGAAEERKNGRRRVQLSWRATSPTCRWSTTAAWLPAARPRRRRRRSSSGGVRWTELHAGADGVQLHISSPCRTRWSIGWSRTRLVGL